MDNNASIQINKPGFLHTLMNLNKVLIPEGRDQPKLFIQT